MRLDALLSQRGYCSRKEVTKLIRQERLLSKTGVKLRASESYPEEEIILDDEPIDPERLVLICHKAAGFVCSMSFSEGARIFDMLPPRYLQRRPPISTVGRLDKDTTGLLVLTDDGDLIHQLTSPKKQSRKLYIVETDKPIAHDLVSQFASGELLLPEEEKKLLPAELKITGTNTAELIITEGKFHQIKKMFELFGLTVTKLHRAKIGELALPEDLKVGEWRRISEEELKLLLS